MANRERDHGKDSSERDARKQGDKNKTKNSTGDNNYLSPDRGWLEKSPSLQRIHQQSSTETSGLGETITSGFSSQESIRSIHSGCHEPKELCNHGDLRNQLNTGKDPCKEVDVSKRQMRDETETRPLINNNAYQRRSCPRPDQERTSTYKAHPPQERQKKHSRTMQQSSSPVQGLDFDELFIQSESRQTPQYNYSGLNVSDVDRHWSRRGSVKSIRSVSSKSSKQFLGQNLESAWSRWSRERRASYQRRLKPPEETAPIERASTPVKKARQECIQFLHPDLEKFYISEEDKHYIRQHRQQRNQIHNVIEKSKKGQRNAPCHTEVLLSETQWNILQDFWNHSLFYKTRYAAVFFGFLTTLLMIIAITNSYWSTYIISNGVTENSTVHEGLFVNCTSVIYEDQSETELCETLTRDWQNAVIALMIFAASFGFIAAVLAVCGVCTSPLPKKIYYFHSAGEIFLVCALSTGIALIIYPVSIEVATDIDSHQYGAGYGFGWGSAFFFLVSSFCMSLDELVRESSKAKCCRLCWKTGNTERGELQSV